MAAGPGAGLWWWTHAAADRREAKIARPLGGVAVPDRK